MLKFTFLGFPVVIHWFFWINAALIGGALDAQGPAAFQRLLVWMVVVFASILIHELGHAMAMRRLGDRRGGIVLFALGGFAQGSLPRTRGQDIWVTAAGPLAQLAGAAFVWLCIRAYPPVRNSLLEYGTFSFVTASVFWAVLNIMPVLPLDGGRIAAAIAGPRNIKLALGLSLVCAVALALFMGSRGAWIGAILFAVLAYNSFQQIRGAKQVPLMGVQS